MTVTIREIEKHQKIKGKKTSKNRLCLLCATYIPKKIFNKHAKICEKEYLLKRNIKCGICWDKGYSTEFKGDEFCMADFIGDKTYRTRKSGFRIRLCQCERGKNLKKYFNIKKEFQI